MLQKISTSDERHSSEFSQQSMLKKGHVSSKVLSSTTFQH